MKKFDFKSFIVITLITFIVGNFFSFFIINSMDTFEELNKPINIPGLLFPIIWSIIYLLMSVSCYLIYKSNDKNKKTAIIIYVIQLIVNSLWTLIFFGFESYLFSFIWIIFLTILVSFTIFNFYKIDKKAAYLNILYLIWIAFAGYLNLGIYILNR